MKKNIAVLSLVFLFSCFLQAAQPAPAAKNTDTEKNNIANKYFSIAAEKYVKGDNQGAVEDLEKCLEVNPEHSSAKNMLGLCLTELVAYYYNENKFVDALASLDKLIKLFPNDQKIQGVYVSTKKKVEEQLKGVLDIPISPAEIEILFSLLDSPLHEQEKMVNLYQGDEKALMETVITQARKVQSDLITKFKTREDKTVSTMIKTYIFTAVGIALFIVLMVLLLIVYIHKRDSRREQIMMLSYEKIVDKLQPFITTAADKNLKGNEYPHIIKNINHQGKLRGVEVIEAELVETDKEIGERLLKPFIEDSNIEVRARAIKALYKYNPIKALKDLFIMSKDTNPEIRITVAQLLGQIGTEDSIRILIQMKDETDQKVKREVIKNLYEIFEGRSASLAKNVVESVENVLKENKDEWIIK